MWKVILTVSSAKASAPISDEGRLSNANQKTRHDGIAGAIITAGVALGYYGSPLWLWLPGIIGVTLVQSAFTGFCPVYYTLDKIGIGE